MRPRRRERDARETPTRVSRVSRLESLVVAASERESRDAVERDAVECDATMDASECMTRVTPNDANDAKRREYAKNTPLVLV